MSGRLPPLVDRIAELLADSPLPRSGADLARRFLGIGVVDEEVADRVLSPLLADDSRFRRGPAGWTVAGTTVTGADRLDAPCDVILAPARPAAAERLGPPEGGEPRLTVCLEGEPEVRRFERLTGRRLPRPAISLLTAARRLRGYRGGPDPAALAAHLGASHVAAEGAAGWLAALRSAWEELVAQLELEEIGTTAGLDSLLEESLEAAESEGRRFGKAELLDLPPRPGIYVFRDRREKALYVGQSSILSLRVRSYFRGCPRDEKDRAIRSEAHFLETRECDSGLDALIEEDRAIRRLRPRLNVRRQIHGAPPETGVLLLPTAAADRFVLYALTRGGLTARAIGRPGRRGEKAIRRVLDALALEPPLARAALREAALAGTWLRCHSGTTHLRPGIDGDRRQIERRLLVALDGERAQLPGGVSKEAGV